MKLIEVSQNQQKYMGRVPVVLRLKVASQREIDELNFLLQLA
jgi:hypothetical protein